MGQLLKEHEISSNHFQSSLSVIKFQKSQPKVDTALKTTYYKEVAYWRNVLRRLLDITQYLASHDMAFRGTGGCEQLGNLQNGPSLSLVELLSKYDPILSEHVLKVKSKQIKDHYLGKNIQNELIQ